MAVVAVDQQDGVAAGTVWERIEYMSGLLTRPILRRWIAVTLRRYRQNAGISRGAAAKAAGCTDTRITHLEQGRNLPQPSDVDVLLPLYGLGEEQISELNGLVERVRDAAPEADLSKMADIPSGFDTYLGLESGAVELDVWDVLPVPGLLQIRPYAEALLGSHETGLRQREVARRVELRMRRQEVLHRAEQPLQLRAFLDESVLRRCIAGPEVQHKQLQHLLEISKLPNVSIRVLSLAHPALRALHGPFMILTLPIPGDPGLVYLEDRTGGRAIDDGDQVDEYLEVRDILQQGALTEDASRTLIEQIGDSLA